MNNETLVGEEDRFDLGIKKVSLMQRIGWIILRPLLRFFVRYEVRSLINLNQLKGPLIIASNHVSFLDPIFVAVAFPKNCQIYPVFFVAMDSLFETPVFKGLIKSCGAFPVCKKQGYEKALETPKQILAAGQSLVIFPQAHLRPEFRVEEGRVGAAMLALESGAPILPVGISGVCRVPLKKFFLRQCRVKVTVGEPFDLCQKLQSAGLSADNFQEATGIIMEEIGKLL